jgi:hypothetical protein
MSKVGIQKIGRRITKNALDLRQKWPQIRENSRKACDRMAAGQGGGCSATMLLFVRRIWVQSLWEIMQTQSSSG